MKPEISIVVCTHNRAAMLSDALASLARLETGGRFRYEIVIVDNASSDQTAQVVEAMRRTWPELRYVYEAKKGIATARNRGYREATGEWIAFFDDDQLAEPGWLRELIAYASDFNLRAVGGPVHLKLFEGCCRKLHPFVCMLLGESRLGSKPFAYSLKTSPGTGNLMLHRSVFEEIGLFDEAFAVRHEDTELFCRMWHHGIEAWYVPSAIIYHVTPPQRLEDSYLKRLAISAGGNVVQREHDTHSLPLFAAKFIAKAAVYHPILGGKLLAARLRGQTEALLGESCHLRLISEYIRCGSHILKTEFKRRLPRLDWFTTKAPGPA